LDRPDKSWVAPLLVGQRKPAKDVPDLLRHMAVIGAHLRDVQTSSD
jgi:hypothetical protein